MRHEEFRTTRCAQPSFTDHQANNKICNSGYLDNCHGSVAEWARAAGLDAFDIWRDVCADVGLDECEPWPGYPKGPKDFPNARVDLQPLPDKIAKLLEQIENPLTH